MKKFILNFFKFLIFTLVGYSILLFLWFSCAPLEYKPNISYKKGSYGNLYTRILDVKNYSNIDILFLGSSHSYRGFDPRIFTKKGYKTFNLGSSAQTPIQTKVLVKRYLRILNPKTVIYEVYPPTLMSDGVESSLDIIANDKNDIYSFLMVLKENNIKVYNTFIYASIINCLKLDKTFTESILKGNDMYISGGFVEKKIAYYKPMLQKRKKIVLNHDQLEAFSDIVRLLKKNNIKVIIVYAPIPKTTYNSYTNNSYFDSLMEGYSEYYNFNEIMSLNDSLDFYDNSHLNINGVELFDKKLIGILYNK